MKEQKIKQEKKVGKSAADVKAQTESTRLKLKLFVEGLENLIADYKPSTNANKRVLMLPLSKLPLAKDKETGEIYVSRDLKPQLFNTAKAKRLADRHKSKEEGAPLVVTKLTYYKARLKAAKGMRELFEKGLEMKAIKPKKDDGDRKKLRQLHKEFNTLDSNQREGEHGEMIRKEIQILTKRLKEAEKGK